MDGVDIYKLDKFIALKPANEDGVKWFLPFEKPLRLAGFNWFEKDMRYNRFPAEGMPETVTQFTPDGEPIRVPLKECGAFLLADNTAGGLLQFRTDSTRILLKGETLSPGGMDHMAFTGSGGFDLYLTEEGQKQRMVGTARFDHSKTEFSVEIIKGMQPEMRDVLIHFPLYNGVKSLYVGVEEGASVLPPKPWKDDRPLVAYGTSILQGGCASRPGMAYTNILSRRLNREVLNFGFSGNGRGEPEIAELLAQVENPAAYIVDYEWNIQTGKEMKATLPVLLDIIRKKHPRVPVVVVSHSPSGPWSQKMQDESLWPAKTRVQEEEVARRRQAGDDDIYYVDGMKVLGDDWDECLVDGCHMTDLGFYRMAESLMPLLKKILD